MFGNVDDDDDDDVDNDDDDTNGFVLIIKASISSRFLNPSSS